MAIPYENTTLPGYFYRAGDPGVPRPTVIMHTGFDGTAAGMRQILQLWAVGSILVGAGRGLASSVVPPTERETPGQGP